MSGNWGIIIIVSAIVGGYDAKEKKLGKLKGN